MEVERPPVDCEKQYSTIITPSAVKFVAELVAEFDVQVDHVNTV